MNAPSGSPNTRIAIPALAAVLALALALLPATPAQAGGGHERDGWLLGMSYGYSRGKVQIAGTDEDYRYRNGATPQVRFGRMVNRHLALHMEYGGWMFEDGIVLEDIGLKARLSLQNVVLAATWYPGDPDGPLGGLYVRGGAGFGWASLAVVLVDENFEEAASVREDEDGLGLQAALGYEWRIARHTAAGLSVGLQHLDIDGDIYRKATWVPLTFSLVWYWG